MLRKALFYSVHGPGGHDFKLEYILQNIIYSGLKMYIKKQNVIQVSKFSLYFITGIESIFLSGPPWLSIQFCLHSSSWDLVLSRPNYIL